MARLRLVALSDTHSMHRNITVPDGDVLIHCGDFCGYGRLDEFVDFVEWFSTQPHKYKLFTAGNHDIIVERSLEACRSRIPGNVRMLIDQDLDIEGIKFYGAPWVPKFGNWSFMRPRGAKMREVWDRITSGTNVLITHGPPYGHGDVAPAYHTANPKVAGCMELLNAVDRVRPVLHFFGHIHDGYGRTNSDEFESTTFINAAICNEAYEPVNKPQVVDVELKR